MAPEGFDSGLFAEVVLERDQEGLVVLEFGGACARGLGRFIEAGPSEGDLVGSVVDIEASLQGPKPDVAVAVGLDDQGRGSTEVEMVAIPPVRLDDAPATDDRVVGRPHCAAPVRSSGARGCRLPTRGRPRSIGWRRPPTIFIQPKAASMRFPTRGLAPHPGWRGVQPVDRGTSGRVLCDVLAQVEGAQLVH